MTEARLTKSGEYRLGLSTDQIALLGVERSFSARVGYNRLDWAVENGTLTVAILNWDRSSPVDLKFLVFDTGDQAGGQVENRIKPDESFPFTVVGLGFRDYSIEARQRTASGAYRISREEQFSLSPERAHVSVELDLQTYESAFVLKSPMGAPLTRASVRTYYGVAKETEPGVHKFSADIGRQASDVVIHAEGYLPLCKSAPASAAFDRTDDGYWSPDGG